ncbi:Hypothetical predicted protein [Octopus vulgaris]|uniref:Uncharacterized protein n=1 Tax=Octopus vulgaris TaxID=6645 RepID=A0AA36BVP5_OCTVU|nr:Hypothetical predicted protein [Octopus vulgaris]
MVHWSGVTRTPGKYLLKMTAIVQFRLFDICQSSFILFCLSNIFNKLLFDRMIGTRRKKRVQSVKYIQGVHKLSLQFEKFYKIRITQSSLENRQRNKASSETSENLPCGQHRLNASK